jgi:ribonucleoside-diphosphate reductase alpha chain
MSDYKLPEIKKVVQSNRKIGLGIMGFADLLFLLRIAYNSNEGVNIGEKLMEFIEKEAKNMSAKLGEQKGSFPNFPESVYPKKGFKTMRNATVTTIAPAGTLSMITDTTSGIEPLFALVYTKHVLDGSELLYTDRFFENDLKKAGIYSKDMMRKVAKTGSIRKLDEIPDELKKIYVVSSEISPEWHVRMQAAFQKYTDNAASKTINFPANATIDDVKEAFLLAHKLGCKGLTIYRDASRSSQVLTRTGDKNTSVSPGQTQLPFSTESNSSVKGGKKIEEVIPPPISSD